MQGRILEVDLRQGRGLLLGADGNRYGFPLQEWKSPDPPIGGLPVDFVAEAGEAKAVFPLQPHFAQPSYGYVPQSAGFSFGANAPGDNSATMGGIGVVCLALGFVVPLLPTIAALVLGLIGAGTAKRYNNGTGLVLSRVSWIGALVMLAFGIALIIFGLSIFGLLFGPIFAELMRESWTSV